MYNMVYAVSRLCLSVNPLITIQYTVKMAKYITINFSPPNSLVILELKPVLAIVALNTLDEMTAGKMVFKILYFVTYSTNKICQLESVLLLDLQVYRSTYSMLPACRQYWPHTMLLLPVSLQFDGEVLRSKKIKTEHYFKVPV